ncbi:MAG: M20/M25/M40 family metallo-hydrolase, partial [Phocaeicola sp.]
DMVCVDDGTISFNPLTDPIKSYVKDGWITAHNTSLGADNGVGMAVMLAILENKDLKHPKLECLLTVDEEVGLIGAKSLAPDFIEGRKILNIDTGSDKEIVISSAAILTQVTSKTYEKIDAPADLIYYKINFGGGLGGHSGLNINQGRANSILMSSKILNTLSEEFEMKVSEIGGGVVANGIPNDAKIVVGLKTDKVDAFVSKCKKLFEEAKEEYKEGDPNLSIRIESTDKPRFLIDDSSIKCILSALSSVKNGVFEMSTTVPGMVALSSNVGCMKQNENEIVISVMTRGENNINTQNLGNDIRQCFLDNDITSLFTEDSFTPGWSGDPTSSMVSLIKSSFHSKGVVDVKITGLHAGLECGYIQNIYPDADVVSIGFNIEEGHSINERVEISSIKKMWEIILSILSNADRI